jgi:hypothetical protein
MPREPMSAGGVVHAGALQRPSRASQGDGCEYRRPIEQRLPNQHSHFTLQQDVCDLEGLSGLVLSNISDFRVQYVNNVLSSDFQQLVYVSSAHDGRLVLENLRI